MYPTIQRTGTWTVMWTSLDIVTLINRHLTLTRDDGHPSRPYRAFLWWYGYEDRWSHDNTSPSFCVFISRRPRFLIPRVGGGVDHQSFGMVSHYKEKTQTTTINAAVRSPRFILVRYYLIVVYSQIAAFPYTPPHCTVNYSVGFSLMTFSCLTYILIVCLSVTNPGKTFCLFFHMWGLFCNNEHITTIEIEIH